MVFFAFTRVFCAIHLENECTLGGTIESPFSTQTKHTPSLAATNLSLEKFCSQFLFELCIYVTLLRFINGLRRQVAQNTPGFPCIFPYLAENCQFSAFKKLMNNSYAFVFHVWYAFISMTSRKLTQLHIEFFTANAHTNGLPCAPFIIVTEIYRKILT